MATRTLQMDGQIIARPAAITITIGGTQVFSGEPGASLDLDDWGKIANFTFDGSETVAQTVAVVVSVTSGIVKIGGVQAHAGDTTGVDAAKVAELEIGGFYTPGLGTPGVASGLSERTNILINGSPVTRPSTLMGFDPGPEGSEHWANWAFEVSAGESLSFDLLVPPTITNLA